MSYERILVPTDGSDATRDAATHALDIAERFGAELHALYVVGDERVEQEAVRTELETAGRRATDELVALADERGLVAEGAVQHGSPSDRILRYVDEADVDLVVMATSGRTGVGRVLLGSVAERVARHSDVPVLLVRSTGEHAVRTREQATRAAREALAAEGHEDPTIPEEPYRAASTWVVRATADGETFNVHVDPVTGRTNVARIRPRE